MQHINQQNKLVVAISSRALFDLDESNHIYEQEGVEAYANYQIANEHVPLAEGVAFSLVKKLLALNTYGDLVEVVLLSRNSADTGLRIFNSIKAYQLDISRAAFTGGQSPYQYIESFGTDLFLSAHPDDVKQTLAAGYAAAMMLPSNTSSNNDTQLRMAFDGDAVLFSDESERIYQEQGLAAFEANEHEQREQPLSAGPFHGFLKALHVIQSHLPSENCPLRTALVTARAAPSHERVIRTLRAWNIRIDEALFLGGMTKGEFLKAFGADIFFDDQLTHCQSSQPHVATGHVLHGVTN